MYIVPTYRDAQFETKFLEVISGATVSFIGVLDAQNHQFIYINQGGAILFEYPDPETMLTTGQFHINQCRCSDEKKCLVLKRVDKHKAFETESEFITGKGNSFWGKAVYTPFTHDEKKFFYVQIDKTDRAHIAEENLQEEQQRFQAFLEFASIGVITVDKFSKIVVANPFACSILGYESGELFNKPLNTIIPIRYREKHVQYHSGFFEAPKVRPMETGKTLYALKKDGTEIPVDISLGTYTINQDVFVISFIADISNRKKNEEAIRKLNAELEEKIKDRTLELKKTIDKLYLQIKETEDAEKGMHFFQQLFHQVVDNYPAGSISVLNTEFQYIFCGGAALAHHSHHSKDLIGKRFLPELGNTDWLPIQEILEKVFEGQTISDFEMPISWKEQSFSFDAFPLTDNDGNISRIAIITRNTSALKKVEKELQEALIKEKELSSLKSRFISIASHEFRTPLSTVLSSAYLLEKYTGSKEQPKREKHIERIVTAVNSLTDILNDFLSVGRIEEGRVSIKLTNFNIPKLVTGIIDELNPLEKKGQTVDYIHTGSEEIVLDPSILKHIITNLLSNALKFSPEDKTITIKTNCDYSGLDLVVSDEGIGIPDVDREHLFERFFRATNVSHIQGTGLGLHIVSRYTELLEGTIQCMSELEKGTTFDLHFPAKNNTIGDS